MVLPELASWKCEQLIFAPGEGTYVWLQIREYMASNYVSVLAVGSFSWWSTYFQSTRFVIRLNTCPQISQVNGIPCATSFGVGGTLKDPQSFSARLETKEE